MQDLMLGESIMIMIGKKVICRIVPLKWLIKIGCKMKRQKKKTTFF